MEEKILSPASVVSDLVRGSAVLCFAILSRKRFDS